MRFEVVAVCSHFWKLVMIMNSDRKYRFMKITLSLMQRLLICFKSTFNGIKNLLIYKDHYASYWWCLSCISEYQYL